MLGLFGALDMGQRSMQTQSQGIEISGHNIANISNPAFSRQRLAIQSSVTLQTKIGSQGTGVDAVAIMQVRDALIDRQIQNELSISGYLESRQNALQRAQSDLGDEIDRLASGAEGTAAAQGSGSLHSIAEGITDLFNAFQSVATSPTSMSERQILTIKAQDLASRFNLVDNRLSQLITGLNDSVEEYLSNANTILKEIARLNYQIFNSEVVGSGIANDLRDQRQAKIEELSQLINITTAEQSNGMVDISVSGQLLVSGNQISSSLRTYLDSNGNKQVEAVDSSNGNATPLTLTGGKIFGVIDTRDNDIISLKNNLNTLAAEIISQVNQIHTTGYSLTGSTGELFFEGTDASSMQVNQKLVENPSLIQAAGTPDAPGDNSKALEIARLVSQPIASLNNQTFNQRYNQIAASLGQALYTTNNQYDDQQVVQSLLKKQRDSISGVSLDEEITNIMKYQRAFQASAKFINTLDEMLDTVMSLKR